MEFIEIIKQRRAVNFFDPEKDISDDLFKDIVNTAAYTPSSFNLQPWNLVVLRDFEDKEKLKKLAMGQPKVSEAPVTAIVLADIEGWKNDNEGSIKVITKMIEEGTAKESQFAFLGKVGKKLYGYSKEAEVAYACKNTGFFAMSLMLAAKAKGVDTHPMDGIDMDGIKKEFKIPDKYWVPMIISFGYFDKTKELPQAKWKKTYDDIVISFE
ncbi:MAG: nitroreductase family protein [Desulfobacterales bacterium]|nr:nitroreductase family protein [Desulfobacterales bacterium]MCP4161703.1 nitroreductase family protein [Deltaproteobacteria bacterium]